MSETVEAPICPGCHFGCLLDAYKCGRGKGFAELWKDGKPVPERGVPPFMRSEKDEATASKTGTQGGAAMPVGTRVMHGLNIMANILGERHTESADRKVLMAVVRQGGFFAIDMVGRRTLVDEPKLSQAIEELLEVGFIVRDEDEAAGEILRATPEGKEQFVAWNAERDAATAEFLSPLSEEEQVQLSQMLQRIIQHEVKKKHEATGD